MNLGLMNTGETLSIFNSKQTVREAVRGSGVSWTGWKQENRRGVFILQKNATHKLSPPEREEAAGERD